MLNANKSQNQNNLMQRLNTAKEILSGKNPQDIYNALVQSNPQFRQFVKDNEGKTIEDVALEYDIDLSILKQFM